MQRLKTRPQFQAVLAGRLVAKTGHFALHRLEIDPASPAPFPVHGTWIGAMVPKRWAKRAVTRNTIKRQIYNVSSILESSLRPMAHVVRLRSGFDRTWFISATSDALKMAVCTELNQLFAKANGMGNGTLA